MHKLFKELTLPITMPHFCPCYNNEIKSAEFGLILVLLTKASNDNLFFTHKWWKSCSVTLQNNSKTEFDAFLKSLDVIACGAEGLNLLTQNIFASPVSSGLWSRSQRNRFFPQSCIFVKLYENRITSQSTEKAKNNMKPTGRQLCLSACCKCNLIFHKSPIRSRFPHSFWFPYHKKSVFYFIISTYLLAMTNQVRSWQPPAHSLGD